MYVHMCINAHTYIYIYVYACIIAAWSLWECCPCFAGSVGQPQTTDKMAFRVMGPACCTCSVDIEGVEVSAVPGWMQHSVSSTSRTQGLKEPHSMGVIYHMLLECRRGIWTTHPSPQGKDSPARNRFQRPKGFRCKSHQNEPNPKDPSANLTRALGFYIRS